MFTHMCEIKAQEKKKNMCAKSKLCVVFIVYTCFTNVHTCEAWWKMFLFLVFVLVLIS